MKAEPTYEDVKKILDDAVGRPPDGPHGPFWRTYETLVAGSYRRLPYLVRGDGANSNIIKALKGQEPFNGSRYERMPSGRDAVPPEKIAVIERWIDLDCPR